MKDTSRLVYNGVWIYNAEVSYNSSIEKLHIYYRNVYLMTTPLTRPKDSVYLAIL